MRFILIMITLTAIGCASVERKQAESSNESGVSNVEEALKLNQEAVLQIEKRNFSKAMQLLQEGLEWDKECGALHNNLGYIYFMQSNLYHAALEFQCAVNLMPNNSEAANNLGLVYEKASQIDKAIDWYERAMDIEQENPEVLGNYARACIKRGNSSSRVLEVLNQLSIEDPRPEWAAWAKRQAALMVLED